MSDKTALCDYCYHERETTEITVAGLLGFTRKRICAACVRKYARPVRMPQPPTQKAGDV